MLISGIRYFGFYTTNNKKILLLGETHQETTKLQCKSEQEQVVDIASFLVEDILNKKPKDNIIDFFFESGFKENTIRGYKTGLSRAPSVLEETVPFIAKKGIRVHHVDPRKILVDGRVVTNSLTKFLSQIEKTHGKFTQKYKEVVDEDTLKNALLYLLDINREENRKYFLKVLESMVLMGFNPNMKEFEDWEDGYFKIIHKRFKKLDERIISKEDLIKVLLQTYEIMFENLLNGTKPNSYVTRFVLLLSAPADLYVLTRLFTKFENKRDIITNSENVDSVVVYSGVAHSYIYSTFLNIFYQTSPIIEYSSPSKREQCVKIPDSFDFWKN